MKKTPEQLYNHFLNLHDVNHRFNTSLPLTESHNLATGYDPHFQLWVQQLTNLHHEILTTLWSTFEHHRRNPSTDEPETSSETQTPSTKSSKTKASTRPTINSNYIHEHIQLLNTVARLRFITKYMNEDLKTLENRMERWLNGATKRNLQLWIDQSK